MTLNYNCKYTSLLDEKQMIFNSFLFSKVHSNALKIDNKKIADFKQEQLFLPCISTRSKGMR